MPILDRTTEFRACVDSISKRSASIPSSRDADQRQRRKAAGGAAGGSRSEFSNMAAGISRDISSTTVKLGKLAQCECSLVSWSGMAVLTKRPAAFLLVGVMMSVDSMCASGQAEDTVRRSAGGN